MVSEVVEPSMQYLEMSYEDYMALPSDVHAEWVDGVVVVAPTATWGHQNHARWLANIWEAALPDLVVATDVSTRLPHNRERERRPDVVAFAEPPPEESPIRGFAPVLVAEVLSPSTQSEDLIRKAPEYLRAGAEQYWVVDARRGSIEIFVRSEEGWDRLGYVDATHPEIEVQVASFGTVHLDVREVLRD